MHGPSSAFAHRWAGALRDAGLPAPVAALGELAATLLRALDDPAGDDAAAAVGAGMVAARLAGPDALRLTVELIGAEFGAGPRVGAVQGAVAAGYASELAELTRREHESVVRSVLNSRRDTETALRTSDARFHAVFSQAGMGIAIADLDGTVSDANTALLDMSGHTLDDLRGRNLGEFVHAEDVGLVWPHYLPLVRGESDGFRVEVRLLPVDGNARWAQLTMSLVRDGTGAPQFVVAMMEDVTERHRLQHSLRHQALHDPLTRLPNRAMFTDRLARVFEGDVARVGLCYLDLDGFKVINDSLGHEIGDQLLVAVARRLERAVAGTGRLAARMGGDEFVILAEDTAGAGEMVELAEVVLAAVAEPVHVAGQELRVSASLGLVERTVAGTSAAELVQAADITLYWAKSDGKGRWARYDAERNARQVARFTLAAMMPAALGRGEFYVDYQPLVGLPDGMVAGVEALVRWQHPQFGRLAPDRFIGLAEETGLIVPIGRWVLREACLQARAWNDVFVSVNLAEVQARDPGLVEEVSAVLVETGLAPGRLQLELTESSVMGGDDEALRTLNRLAALGVRIAIDDFGTGYSNLAYLRRLPVHELKIAGAFMDGLRSAAGDPVDERIVQTLVSLAHTLGLTVTAEGVETAAQAARLRDIGCDRAQGWFYARPGPPEAIDALLTGPVVGAH